MTPTQIKEAFSLLARIETKTRDIELLKKGGKTTNMHNNAFVTINISTEYIVEILNAERKKAVAELKELGANLDNGEFS